MGKKTGSPLPSLTPASLANSPGPERASWAPGRTLRHPPSGSGSPSIQWLRLSLGSLMLAGILALVLVAGRVPGFSDLVPDPLFAKRCLVVHVNLALGVWLTAFLASLASLLPGYRAGRRQGPRPGSGGSFFFWPSLAAAGLLLALIPAGLNGVQPVLSNYVPALDHPLFLIGLGIFAFSAAAVFAGRSFAAAVFRSVPDAWPAPGDIPPAAAAGLKAAMVVFLLAMVTLYASALATPRTYPAEAYYELVFWGMGHLLQTAHVAGMLSCWILLVTQATGKPPIGGRAAGLLFSLLAAPALMGPLLAAGGTHLPAYHTGFTLIMRWGTWPVVLVFLAACLRHLAVSRTGLRTRKPFRDPYLAGFLASVLLTLAGFGLGAFIRGPNAMVPAHYHAAVGGVTAAYMAAAFLLAGRAGRRRPAGLAGRLLPWQPGIYGIGQLVFALGFGFAGLHGAARKTYGSEQHVKSLSEHAGLAVMGIGGLVAVAGGLLFLWLLAGMLAPGAGAGKGDGRGDGGNANPTPQIGDRHG